VRVSNHLLSIIFGICAILFLAIAATRAGDVLFAVPGAGEATSQSSIDVVLGRGTAPDQYRYLPHLIVAGLSQVMSYKHAISCFTFFFLSIFLLLTNFAAWPQRQSWERAALCIVFALLYPLSMPFGPRFDTALYLALMILGLCFWERSLFYLLLIVIFATARADYALFLAVFILLDALEHGRKLGVYIVAIAVPIVVQLVFQFWLFSGSKYYTSAFTLSHNLSVEIFQAPGFWYTIGILGFIACHRVCVSPQRPGVQSARATNIYIAKWLTLACYILLCLFVARMREWRLMLPMLLLLPSLAFGPARLSVRNPIKALHPVGLENAQDGKVV
jgi:hypothetical protein